MTVRNISAEGLRELFAQNSGAVMLTLLTFSHATLPTPIRLVNDRRPLTYGGQSYIALPFEMTLPDDLEERIPSVEVKIDNVGRELVTLLRSTSEIVAVDVEVVRVQNGVVTSELGPLDFSLLDAKITPQTITLSIGYAIDILNEQATKEIFNPGTAPALFA